MHPVTSCVTVAVFVVLAVLSTSCGDEPSAVSSCVPNASSTCVCADGSTGHQVCLSDGTFEPCQCENADAFDGNDKDEGDTTPPSDTLVADAADTFAPSDLQPDSPTCSNTPCGEACVDTSSALEHCGQCDVVCTGGPNASPLCSNGVCGLTCSAGFFDCDADLQTGCETDYGCELLTPAPPGNAAASSPWISGDGRYVVLASEADDLIPDDNNAFTDIFLWDRLDNSIQRINLALNGEEADAPSHAPVISEDGRYVFYTSEATNLVAFDFNDLSDLFIYSIEQGTTERLSQSFDGSEVDQPILGRPSVSADGRFVAFATDASRVVENDTNGVADVFVLDREASTTERISLATLTANQGNSASHEPAISADGRFVTFTSEASNLIGDDTNGVADVFVHDRQSATTDRVSVATDRREVTQASWSPAISADGSSVAFISRGDFGIGPPPTHNEVFLVTLASGQIERVSLGANNSAATGDASHVTLSRDGRYVTYDSAADNIIPFDNNALPDIIIYSRLGGSTRVNVSSSGADADGISRSPVISADGRFVAFVSAATNLFTSDTNGVDDVLVFATGIEAGGGVVTPTCASGERYCLGVGCVTLDGDPFCGECGIVCTDTSTYTSVCDSNQVCTQDCRSGLADCNSLPEDGCEIDLQSDVLHCNACDAVCSTAQGTPTCQQGQCQIACQAYYEDCDTDVSNGCETHLVTTTDCLACGIDCGVNTRCQVPSGCGCQTDFLDCDGDTTLGCEVDRLTDEQHCGACGVACPPSTYCLGGQCYCKTTENGSEADLCASTGSSHSAVSCDVANADCQLTCTAGRADCDGLGSTSCEFYLGSWWSACPGSNVERVTVPSNPLRGFGLQDISSDGQVISGFRTTANRVYNRSAMTFVDEPSPTGSPTVLSGNGRYIIYPTVNAELAGDSAVVLDDIYRFDTQTGTYAMASITQYSPSIPGLDPRWGDAATAAGWDMSESGRYVVFVSRRDMATGIQEPTRGFEVYLKDMNASTLPEPICLTSGEARFSSNESCTTPKISSDGRYVLFLSTSSALVAGDTNNKPDLFLRDRTAGTTERVTLTAAGTQSTAASAILSTVTSNALSANGRVVAFVAASNDWVSGDTNNRNDIFVRDLDAGTTERVSVASDGTQANGHSWDPTLSGDGRYVVFHASASNLVPDDTNGVEDVFVHDRQNGTTERVSVAFDGRNANARSWQGIISDDGTTIAFTSDATNLVPSGGGSNEIYVVTRP